MGLNLSDVPTPAEYWQKIREEEEERELAREERHFCRNHVQETEYYSGKFYGDNE